MYSTVQQHIFLKLCLHITLQLMKVISVYYCHSFLTIPNLKDIAISCCTYHCFNKFCKNSEYVLECSYSHITQVLLTFGRKLIVYATC